MSAAILLSRRRGVLAEGGAAAGGDAVTVEAASTWEQTDSGTSLTATAPAATADDDLLVAFVMARSEVTPPAGWTLIGKHKAANGATNLIQEHQLWRKDAVVADASSNFTFSQATANRMALQILLLRSTSGTFKIEDDSALRRNDRLSSIKQTTAPEVTSPGDGRLAVLFGGCVFASNTEQSEFTLPAGYTRHSPTVSGLRGYVGTAPVDDGETSPSGDIEHDGDLSSPGSNSHGESHGILMIGPDAPDELTIEAFTADGTWDWAAAGSPSTVEVLVVAGGGAGGDMGDGNFVGCGGGGAGGVQYDDAFTVTGNVSVTVGAGGDGTFGGAASAFDGGDSSFGALTATGGGGGDGTSTSVARDGGSGGGGRFNDVGGSGTAGQGFDGGDGESSGDQISGGGGGAGIAGFDGVDGGHGGTGARYGWAMVYGELGYFAGGGGGGAYQGGGLDEGGFGGRGGGGNGGDEQGVFPAALPNIGGGGGGAGGSSSSGTTDGGDGGSGIVLVRYPTP